MVFKNLLVVEGLNDQYVAQNILKKNGVSCESQRQEFSVKDNQAIIIQSQGSREKLLSSLDSLLDSSELERLGIIVDADGELELKKTWGKLQSIFIKRNLDLPDKPASPFNTEVIIAFRQILVGIWIMPGDGSHGELEDFFASLIPQNDLLWDRAVNSVEAIPSSVRRFKKISKAKVHTWLAWQKEPGEPMGRAIEFGYVQADSNSAINFMKWIRVVFGL